MNYVVMILPIVLGLFLLTGVSETYADHGHGTGGGGGCGGDCTPPTLGTDNAGHQIVDGGFAINGNAFDVNYFKQDIPTQAVTTGKPVRIALTIHENTGPEFLSYVGLMMGLEDKFVSGVMVPTHTVQIHWEKDTGGKTAVEVDDPHELVKNVGVNEAIKGQNNVVTFEFTPAREFDTSIIIAKTWDMERNSWTNYFFDAIIITGAETDVLDRPVPEWIKDVAGLWAEDAIDDDMFVQGLQYLVQTKVIILPPISQELTAESIGIPEWIKDVAGLWAEDAIDDDMFVRAIQYMATSGIMRL